MKIAEACSMRSRCSPQPGDCTSCRALTIRLAPRDRPRVAGPIALVLWLVLWSATAIAAP